MKKLALAVALLLCGQVYAADDWAQRWPNNTPLQVITPATGASTFLKLDQTTPQTVTGGAPNFSSAIDFTQIATPSNPAAGSNRLYFKSDDKLYKLTSGGVESLVGGGGGGSSISFGSAGQIPYTNATTDDFSYGAGLSWNSATSTLTATNIVGDLTGNVTGNVSGNASTATSASSATSATNAANTAITDDTTTNAIMYPTWVTANTGNLPQKVSSTKLSFNPSSGLLTATGFSGPLTGNVTGNVSGNAGTVTNGVYTTDAGTVFLAPNGDGQNLSNVVHSESDPLSATKALDNITSCAINTSLLSDTADTDSLGSADKEWLNLYIGDAGKIYLGLGQDTSIHRSGANEMTLTASSGVKATNFISTASLGTSPYACTSTTLNTNLNADYLDGQHGSYYAPLSNVLKLDQATPQTIIGGAPNFSAGLTATTDSIHLHPAATLVIASSTSRGKNAADYVCDGTDDDVQIQAAINALPAEGGRISLLEGVYSISDTIIINKRITITGQQSGDKGGGTKLVLANNADCDMFDLVPASGASTTHYQLTRFEHLMLDGNKNNQSTATHAIDQNEGSAVDMTIYDCWFDSWKGYCIDLQQYWDHHITRCIFEHNDTYAIHFESTNGHCPNTVWIKECFYPSVIQDGTDRGYNYVIADNYINVSDAFNNFDLWCSTLVFTGNTTFASGAVRTANTYTILKLNSTTGGTNNNNFVISNNIFKETSDKYAIDIGGGGTIDINRLIISGNIFQFGDGTSIIRNTGTGQLNNFIVSNNTFRGQDDDSMTGIYVGDSNVSIVSNNTFTDFATAIDISDASCFNPIVSNNEFDGCTIGISAGGSTTYEPLIYGNKEDNSSTFIVRGDNGVLPATDDEVYGIFINNSAAGDNCEIDIISGTSGNSTINFGDSADEDAGYIDYDNNTNLLTFSSTGDITLSPTGNDVNLTNSNLTFNSGYSILGTSQFYINVDGDAYESYYSAGAISNIATWTNHGTAQVSNTSDYSTMSFTKSNSANGVIATSSNDIVLDPAGNDVIIDATGPNYAADSGSNDSYAITISGITLKTGMVIYFKANTANTGACSLNLNSGGAVALKAFHDQDPPDNYIEAGSMVHVIYDGSVYQILSPDANP